MRTAFHPNSSLFTHVPPAPRRGFLDRFLSWVSPRLGAQRAAWREAESQLSSIGGARGYRSSRPSRVGDQQGGSGSADYHLEAERDRHRMIERARQLCRNNAIAAGLISRIVEMVAGCAPRPQAMTSDVEWNQKAEAYWSNWFKRPIDTRQMFTGRDVVRLAIEGYCRDGEFYVIEQNTGAVLCVEADRVSAPPSKRYQPGHVDGIDLDPRTGAPVKYYVAPYRGDEYFNASVTEFEERDEFEARWVLHMARRDRPTQTHGLSLFASCAEWFESLERYIEAEIVSARMAACVGLIIKSAAPSFGLGNITGSQQGNTFPRMNMEPGMVRELAPGEDVYQIDPKRPVTQFGDFVTQFSRILGLPAGLPLELIMLDFSRGSYSSVRGAMTQGHLALTSIFEALKESILAPLWCWKISQGMADGALPQNPEFERHGWIKKPWPQLDPIKEMQAELMALDAGLKTHGEALAGQGKDWDDFIDRRAAEQKQLDERALKFSRSTATRDPLEPGTPRGAFESVDEEVPDAA